MPYPNWASSGPTVSITTRPRDNTRSQTTLRRTAGIRFSISNPPSCLTPSNEATYAVDASQISRNNVVSLHGATTRRGNAFLGHNGVPPCLCKFGNKVKVSHLRQANKNANSAGEAPPPSFWAVKLSFAAGLFTDASV